MRAQLQRACDQLAVDAGHEATGCVQRRLVAGPAVLEFVTVSDADMQLCATGRNGKPGTRGYLFRILWRCQSSKLPRMSSPPRTMWHICRCITTAGVALSY